MCNSAEPCRSKIWIICIFPTAESTEKALFLFCAVIQCFLSAISIKYKAKKEYKSSFWIKEGEYS